LDGSASDDDDNTNGGSEKDDKDSKTAKKDDDDEEEDDDEDDEPDEKRPRRYRSQITQAMTDRMSRALSQRMFLVRMYPLISHLLSTHSFAFVVGHISMYYRA
jgi:hypothetical protein